MRRTLLASAAASLLALPSLAQDAVHGTAEATHAVSANPIEPQKMEMIFTAALFLTFFAVLALFVWPKILGALKAREEKIHGDVASAEQSAKEAAAKLADINQQLANAQKQAQKVVDEARLAAGKVAAEIKANAEREISELKTRATAEISSAKEQAIAEIGGQVAALATAVAGKILAREVSAADQQALVASALREVSAKN